MEFYPVRTMLKEEQRKFPLKFAAFNLQTKPVPKTTRHISTKDKLLSVYFSHEVTSKRFDQKFTISWGRKQEEKQNQNLFFSTMRGRTKGSNNVNNSHTMTFFHSEEKIEAQEPFSAQLKKHSEGFLKDLDSPQIISQIKHKVKGNVRQKDSHAEFHKILAPLRGRDQNSHSKLLNKLQDMNNSLTSKRNKGSNLMNHGSRSLESHMNSSISLFDATVEPKTSTTESILLGHPKLNFLTELDEIYYKKPRQAYKPNAGETNKFSSIDAKNPNSPYAKKKIQFNLKKTSDTLQVMPKTNQEISENKLHVEDSYAMNSQFLSRKNLSNVSLREKKCFTLQEFETIEDHFRSMKLNDNHKKEVFPFGEYDYYGAQLPNIKNKYKYNNSVTKSVVKNMNSYQ